MRKTFSIIANSAMALVLLLALSMRLVSSEPLIRNQPTASVVAQGAGETFVVASIADSGPGTLRQALLDAQRLRGQILCFDI